MSQSHIAESSFESFLHAHNIVKGTIETCFLNNHSTEGKFDAPLADSWLNTLNEVIRETPLIPADTFENAISLHKSVFIDESIDFDSTFTEIRSSSLSKINLSLYQYTKYPSTYVFYGVFPDMHFDTTTKIHRGSDYCIVQFQDTTSTDSILGILMEQKLIHIMSTKAHLLFHETVLPSLPTAGTLPSFAPSLSNSLEDQILTLGYCLRFPSRTIESWSLESVLQKHVDKNTTIPKLFHRQVEAFFQVYIQRLTESMPNEITLDGEGTETALKQWLELRDKTESLYVVVGQWKPTLYEKLKKIDGRYPLHLTSHILQDSRLLAESWMRNPLNWWGQSAALNSMLEEHITPGT